MTNPDNFNRYAYCLNNPLKYTDPSGYVYTGGGDQYTIDKNNLEARAKELGLSRTQWYDDLDKTYNRGIYSIGGGDRGMGPSGFGGGIAFFHGGGGAVGIGSVGGGIYGSDHAPNTLMEKLIAEAGVRRINGDYYAHVPWSARNWELVEQPSGNSYSQLVFESGLKWTNLTQLHENNSGDGYGESFGERLRNLPLAIWNGDVFPKDPNLIKVSIDSNPASWLIGGVLGKGQKAIKLGKYLFNPRAFHSVKQSVLSLTNPKNFSHIVGSNPDLMLKGGEIWLTGTKTGGFYGKSYRTGMTMAEFLDLFL